jgi:hypothetical protein
VRPAVRLGMTVVTLLSGAVVPAVGASAAASVVPSELTDVTCPSATRCFAVGVSFTQPGSNVRTLVERWNGSSWSIVPSPNAAATNTWLGAIACTSTTNCLAVGNSTNSGYGGKAYAARMTGGTWSTVVIPAGGTKAGLSDVACTAADNCLAVGSYRGGTGPRPLAMRWNGQKWTILAVPLPAGLSGGHLSGVDCATPSKCFAVGGSDDQQGPNAVIIERWNGTRWVVDRHFTTPGGVSPELSDVTCPTTTGCRAVGNDGSAFARTLAVAWNGTAWSIEASTNRKSDEENYLRAVTCWTAHDCFAVGGSLESHAGPGHTLTERRHGTTWSLIASPNKDPQYNVVVGVDCIGPKRCFAVGTSNSSSPVIILQWNGTRWANVRTP